MQTFNLLIATPEKTLYHADTHEAIFPGADGLFEVLAHHAPLIAMVKEGTVRITDASGTKHAMQVQEGFFEFHQNKGVLLTLAKT